MSQSHGFEGGTADDALHEQNRGASVGADFDLFNIQDLSHSLIYNAEGKGKK